MLKARAVQLASEFSNLHHSIVAFTESCSDEAWAAAAEGEGWSVGTVIRHIVVAHYRWFDLIKHVIHDEALPDLSRYDPDRENDAHAKAHKNPQRSEVAALLREKGEEIVVILRTLRDDQLDCMFYFQPIDVNWSIEQFFKAIILQASRSHFASMQATSRRAWHH